MTDPKNADRARRRKLQPLSISALIGALALALLPIAAVADGSLDVIAGASSFGSFGLRVTVESECTQNDVTVPDGPFTGDSEIGCVSITANDVDVSGATATFRAGELAVLGEGFSVDAATDFTIVIDAAVTEAFAWVEDSTPTAATAYEATFDLNLDNLTLAENDEVDHLNGYSANGDLQFRAVLRRNVGLGENRLALFAREDGGTFEELPTDFLIPSGFHTVTLSWSAGAGSGEFLASIDGAPLSGLGSLTNGTSVVDFVRWGAPDGTVTTTTGSIDQDEFLSCPFGDGFESGDLCAWLGTCPVPSPSPTASAAIATARVAPEGAADILIEGALVTYLKPAVGIDPPGFFIQAERTGPGLFIAIDPADLTPAPVPGDLVDLRVTSVVTIHAVQWVIALADWQVNASGGRTECLVQDVTTTADLVSDLYSYDCELIAVDGTVSGPFGPSSIDHESAQIDTLAITGDSGLKLRVPTTLREQLDLEEACEFTLFGTPLWRFGAEAQPSAWMTSELTYLDCPAPEVVSAEATDATTVVVTFSRTIDPASVSAGGGQFVFDNGLTASGAVAAGNIVTLTTSAQTGGLLYTVTVDATVLDSQGKGVSGAADSATFLGFLAAPTASGTDI